MSRRFAARFLAALAVLGVLALAAVALAGVGIDAQRWREPAAAALTRALGREVRLEGPARLTLSLRPALRVEAIRIANPPGFGAGDFARIGELELVVALLPLARGELRVHELRGRNVVIRLERASDGRGNWRFDPAAPDPAAGEGSARPRLDLHRVALDNVQIELPGGGTPRGLDFAEVAFDAAPGQAVHLRLRGRGEAFRASASGGPLAGLGGPEPWPIDVRVDLPGAVLNGSGTVSGPLDRAGVRLAFGAGARDLHEVASLLGARAPAAAAALAGELELAAGRTALRSLKGVIGSTAIAGDLALDTAGARAKLAGALAVSGFDPGRTSGSARAPPSAATLAEAFAGLERTGFLLDRLALLDADLQLDAAHWDGLPGDVRDLRARVRIEAGRLAAPFAATIAGARFEGEVEADGAASPPRFAARLAAREAPLGGLAELVFDARHVAGSVRRFEVVLDARGASAGQLARDLDGRIAVAGAQFTYGNYAGGRPVEMRLDEAEVSQPRGRTIAGGMRGSLRGKVFAGTFRAGTVERILRDRRTPFGFDGASGGVRARLSGTLAELAATAGPEVAFDVAAPRARELAPWLGFSSASDARVALKGTARVREGHGSLTGASLLVGRTSIDGEFAWQTVAGKPLVKANLVAGLLDPAEVRALTAPAGKSRATLLEIPILPESLELADADVALKVKRFDGLPLEITDVAFAGRMRGGEITPSPFSLRVEGSRLDGALAVDARGAAPAAALWFAGEDFDAGALLRRLRVARDLDIRIGAVRFYADIRERRLGDALERSSFVAELESGTLALRGADPGAAPRIALAAGTVRADPGAPVTVALAGSAGATPVAISARGGSLRELVESAARLPFALTAEVPAARLEITGAAVPERDSRVALAVALTGERLSALDELFGATLPPWGPFALGGRLRLARRGYEVEALRLALGESVLEGRGTLDTGRSPPWFDVALAAERIRLDDFPLGEWSPFEARDASGSWARPATPTVESTRAAVRDGARRVHVLFSRELLGRAEGSFDLAVQRVFAGASELGRARLRARIERGRATLGPVELEGRSGGTASGTLVYEPRERDLLVEARVKVDRFDYGLLARTLRPRSDLDGVLSMDLQLDATTPRLAAAFALGSGRFDFALWPERWTGGVFDLWAANLLFRLLPIINVSASPVNCMVGHFDLERGRLDSVRLAIDTASTRTEGGGWADFGSSTVELRFVPRPKVPQFFSLATPVEARGTFDEYRFSVRPADAFVTALRWAASPVVVPVQRAFGARIPGDGSDLCANPGR